MRSGPPVAASLSSALRSRWRSARIYCINKSIAWSAISVQDAPTVTSERGQRRGSASRPSKPTIAMSSGNVGASPTQRAGEGVGAVSHLRGGIQNAAARLRRDTVSAGPGQNTGDCRLGKPEPSSDLFCRYRSIIARCAHYYTCPWDAWHIRMCVFCSLTNRLSRGSMEKYR